MAHKASLAGNLPAPAAARIPDALAAFPHLPDEAFADIKTVSAVTSRSPASIWRDVKAGRLPAPTRSAPAQLAGKLASFGRL